MHSVMQCTQLSQFLRLGCVLYVTALEAYWRTEASAALLLSFNAVSRSDNFQTQELSMSEVFLLPQEDQ